MILLGAVNSTSVSPSLLASPDDVGNPLEFGAGIKKTGARATGHLARGASQSPFTTGAGPKLRESARPIRRAASPNSARPDRRRAAAHNDRARAGTPPLPEPTGAGSKPKARAFSRRGVRGGHFRLYGQGRGAAALWRCGCGTRLTAQLRCPTCGHNGRSLRALRLDHLRRRAEAKW